MTLFRCGAWREDIPIGSECCPVCQHPREEHASFNRLARPRTKSEREAFLVGYAEAINDFNEHGLAYAVAHLKECAQLEGLLDE